MAETLDSNAAGVASLGASAAGKYLTFTLGGEIYGLEILKVQEIIGMMPVTRVPRVPEYMRGVINLRGKVIPVVELRHKFGLDAKEDTERTCIVVVQVHAAHGQITMGTIVDEVREVVDVAASQIEPPPAFGSQVDTTFILGMGKLGDKVVILLDVDRVLSSSELAGAAEALEGE